MVDVPARYETMVKWAAGIIGIPAAVVAAQVNEESGFNPGAESPTGAEGMFQFEPSTWSGLGCSGSPFDPSSGVKCYAKYMYQLVHEFHGDVRNALAAYNAGPDNLAAGYGYADTILSAAGQAPGLQAGQGSGQSSATGPTDATLTAAQQSACLIGFSGNLPIIPGIYSTSIGFCAMSKTQGRAVLGTLIMGAGVIIMGAGVALLFGVGGARVLGIVATPARGLGNRVTNYGNRVAPGGEGDGGGSRTPPAGGGTPWYQRANNPGSVNPLRTQAQASA